MRKPKKIGLLGENPNDTQAIANLLKQNYTEHTFKSALKRLTADDVTTPKGLRMIADLWKEKEYDFLIFIKDMDGFEDDVQKRKQIEGHFRNITKAYPKQNVLLINIQELEALILADVSSFDKLLSFTGDPMKIVSPKEHIQRELRKCKSSKTYSENDAAAIFTLLKYENVKKNCRYFAEFIDKFEKALDA